MSHTIKKFIDAIIGTPLCYALRPLVKLFAAKKPKMPKTILIIKLWAIGDTLLILPLANALRETYPRARIDILCRYQNYSVCKGSKLFDDVLLFERAEGLSLVRTFRKYDLVFDGEPFFRISALMAFWMGSYRVGFDHDARKQIYDIGITHKMQHMVENYLEMATAFGINTKNPNALIKIQTTEEDKKVALGLLGRAGIRETDNLIAFAPHVGAEGKTRLWNQDKWAQLGEQLHTKYSAKVIFLGTTYDTKYITEIRQMMKTPSIDFSGQTTLMQTIALVDRCETVVSLDAGLMHIAAAQGALTIGLFGPNTPTLWRPYGPKCRAIYHKVECSPCIKNKSGYIPDCLRKTDRYLCMQLISSQDVISRIAEINERIGHIPYVVAT